MRIEVAGERMVARTGDMAGDRVERFVLAGEAIRAARVHEGELPARQCAGRDRLRERRGRHDQIRGGGGREAPRRAHRGSRLER